MAMMFNYFKRKDSIYLNPQGPLSLRVPGSAILSDNRELEATMKKIQAKRLLKALEEHD